MTDAPRWHLVSYDVRDPKRWRKVYRLVKGYGRRLQYSVFRVRCNRLQIERMRWELERVMSREDDLLIVSLCPSCAQRVRGRNVPEEWPHEELPYKILD